MYSYYISKRFLKDKLKHATLTWNLPWKSTSRKKCFCLQARSGPPLSFSDISICQSCFEPLTPTCSHSLLFVKSVFCPAFRMKQVQSYQLIPLVIWEEREEPSANIRLNYKAIHQTLKIPPYLAHMHRLHEAFILSRQAKTRIMIYVVFLDGIKS